MILANLDLSLDSELALATVVCSSWSSPPTLVAGISRLYSPRKLIQLRKTIDSSSETQCNVMVKNALDVRLLMLPNANVVQPILHKHSCKGAIKVPTTVCHPGTCTTQSRNGADGITLTSGLSLPAHESCRFPGAGILLCETCRLSNACNDGESNSQKPSRHRMPSVMPDDFANTTLIYNTRSVVASSSGRKMNAPAIAITPHRNRAIAFSMFAPRVKPWGARPSYPSSSSSS
ncbi:hypothetical protein F4860DRAFT_108358 [Xylaria cubensis]|nr:hypothetical protein F4860DRAFT_108358 [Xylaria cubensis]